MRLLLQRTQPALGLADTLGPISARFRGQHRSADPHGIEGGQQERIADRLDVVKKDPSEDFLNSSCFPGIPPVATAQTLSNETRVVRIGAEVPLERKVDAIVDSTHGDSPLEIPNSPPVFSVDENVLQVFGLRLLQFSAQGS